MKRVLFIVLVGFGVYAFVGMSQGRSPGALAQDLTRTAMHAAVGSAVYLGLRHVAGHHKRGRRYE